MKTNGLNFSWTSVKFRNGTSLSRVEKLCISKFKESIKQAKTNFNNFRMLQSTIFLYYVKSRYNFCRKITQMPIKILSMESLVTKIKMAHFQGQTSPNHAKPSILFNLCSPLSFLVISYSQITFTKNLHGRPLRHFLWCHFVSTATMTHLQGQMSLEQVNLHFAIFCAI